MRQVTKAKFLAVINPLDVVVTAVGGDSYSKLNFQLRTGKCVGSVEEVQAKSFKPDQEYFLEDEFYTAPTVSNPVRSKP